MKGEQIAAPASGADSTAAKPVIIEVVTPWIEIARMPQYVQASSAERRAIRDLYWRICVEEKIPLEQRESAYWQFVREWESTESGVSRGRATHVAEIRRHVVERLRADQRLVRAVSIERHEPRLVPSSPRRS